MTSRPASQPDMSVANDLAPLGLRALDSCLHSLEDLLGSSDDDILLQLRLSLLRATRLLHLCACRPPAEVVPARRLGRDLIAVCDILHDALPNPRGRAGA